MARRPWILAASAVVLVAGCGSSGAHTSAVSARSGSISIVDPFIPVPTSSLGAFYVTLRNDGGAPDALVGASSPVAASASLHSETTTAGGAETMTDLAQLQVPAHGQAGLVPGHDHLMLMGLNRTLSAGQQVAITLRFAHAAPVVPLAQVADGMGSEGASMGNMAGMG